MDEPTMRDRLANARVARLATATKDGRPHVVPFCFVLDGDTIYTAVDGKPKTTSNLRRLRNVAENPAVQVVADEYSEDWSALWWVRVSGTGRVLRDGQERRRAISLLVAKYEQYARRAPDGPVLAIVVDRWSGWTGSGSRP